MVLDSILVVYGTHFVHTRALSCRFEDVVVQAAWKSGTEVRCAAPARRFGTVRLEVSNNGADFTNSGVQYYFRDAPSVMGGEAGAHRR